VSADLRGHPATDCQLRWDVMTFAHREERDHRDRLLSAPSDGPRLWLYLWRRMAFTWDMGRKLKTCLWILFVVGLLAALAVGENSRSSVAFVGTIAATALVLVSVWAVARIRGHRNAASGRNKLWGLTAASGPNIGGGCSGGSDGGGHGCGGGGHGCGGGGD
jgi:hypothetical protein